jgi:long-subunit acyl-CoA synthetase (AMP-forming)
MKEEIMIFQKLNAMKKSTAAVLAILLTAACIGDVYQAHQAEIAAMQNQSVANMMEAVDPGAYREAEQKEIGKILESTEAAIRESKDQAEMDALVEKAVADTAGFKTDAAYTKEEEGIAKLKKAVDLNLYREAEKKEIKKILDSTEAAISETEDQAEIDALIEKAAEKFAEFKTDAEYSEEEAAAAAAAAAASRKKSKKKKSSGSKGCVGTGSDVFN